MPSGFEEILGLDVLVEKVVYVPELEAPPDRPHPFVYFLNIRNESGEQVQILGRKWVVREDGSDDVIVVEGDGVVGQKPVLNPGEHFSYNSYHVCSSNAVATGSFFGQTQDGVRIRVPIPEFSMIVPISE